MTMQSAPLCTDGNICVYAFPPQESPCSLQTYLHDWQPESSNISSLPDSVFEIMSDCAAICLNKAFTFFTTHSSGSTQVALFPVTNFPFARAHNAARLPRYRHNHPRHKDLKCSPLPNLHEVASSLPSTAVTNAFATLSQASSLHSYSVKQPSPVHDNSNATSSGVSGCYMLAALYQGHT